MFRYIACLLCTASFVISHHSAVLVVDVQNDFTAPARGEQAGGSLYVPKGETIVNNVNRLMEHSQFTVATQDWHPKGHVSFASSHGRVAKHPPEVIRVDYGLLQALWPDHCIQHHWGADFYPSLEATLIDFSVRKGMNKTLDSYSGFFDNARLGQTKLHALLQGQWRPSTKVPDEAVLSIRAGVPKGPITRLFVCGLALDFCVRYSAIDAVDLGYETYLVTDAAMEVVETRDSVIKDLQAKGVKVVTTDEAIQLLRSEASIEQSMAFATEEDIVEAIVINGQPAEEHSSTIGLISIAFISIMLSGAVTVGLVHWFLSGPTKLSFVGTPNPHKCHPYEEVPDQLPAGV